MDWRSCAIIWIAVGVPSMNAVAGNLQPGVGPEDDARNRVMVPYRAFVSSSTNPGGTDFLGRPCGRILGWCDREPPRAWGSRSEVTARVATFPRDVPRT